MQTYTSVTCYDDTNHENISVYAADWVSMLLTMANKIVTHEVWNIMLLYGNIQ